MTVVFVHGNPETPAIWSRLRPELGRADTICLSPPGFGAPLPGAFDATMPAYRDWLIGELEALGRPVHLVGHDWGGGHVVNVAISRPDLLRSWVSDTAGIFTPGHVQHELARIWRTPGAGEELIDKMMFAAPDVRLRRQLRLGMPHDVAESIVSAQGAEMGRAILALYRSASETALAAQWHDLHRARARPGLCVLATEDRFVGTDSGRRRAASRAGARIAVLEGLGHWWMVEDPLRSAAVITEFLDEIEAG